MGYDLVTWAPRVGSGGDDAYNIPGAIKLSGAQDTGSPQPVKVGSSSFSSTPTIAEINASSDINQIIGAVNRRALQWNTLFGTSLSTLSYLSSGVRIKASDITTIQTAINTVRTNEGFASYSFAATPAAGSAIKGAHIADMRKALRISGTASWTVQRNVTPSKGVKWQRYFRTDSAFNTPSTEVLSSMTSGAGPNIDCYEQIDSVGSSWVRARLLWDFPVGDYVTAISSMSLTVYPFTTYGGTTQNMDWWSSNTDDFSGGLSPSFAGRAYNWNTLQAGIQISSLTTPFTLTGGTNSAYTNRAGQHFSSIMAVDIDKSNANPGNAQYGFETDNSHVITFAVDFGA